MTEGAQGIVVLITTSIITSLILHSFIRSIVKASIFSAVFASAIFQVLAYLHLGHLDPFFVIAFVFGSGYAFAVAFVIGLPFVFYRNQIIKKRNHCLYCGAIFKPGDNYCTMCGKQLTFPNSDKLNTVAGWKCPKCGLLNHKNIALCSCGYDSKQASIIGVKK